MTRHDDLAFPLDASSAGYEPSSGLDKREYFASLALQGLCSSKGNGWSYTPETLAEEAVSIANALIEALNK